MQISIETNYSSRFLNLEKSVSFHNLSHWDIVTVMSVFKFYQVCNGIHIVSNVIDLLDPCVSYDNGATCTQHSINAAVALSVALF